MLVIDCLIAHRCVLINRCVTILDGLIQNLLIHLQRLVQELLCSSYFTLRLRKHLLLLLIHTIGFTVFHSSLMVTQSSGGIGKVEVRLALK